MSKSTTLLSYKVFAGCGGPYRFIKLNQKGCSTESMNYLRRKFMDIFYELHKEKAA